MTIIFKNHSRMPILTRGVMIKIIKDTNTEKFKDLRNGVKKAFDAVKEEFNVHLDTINQNTSEVQKIYDYLAEIDSKIEKLNERIDGLQMNINPEMTENQFNVELTHREQEVFVVLYAAQEKITMSEIAKRLGFTDEMVNRYVYNLISKGIPILKQFTKKGMNIYLDLKFKEMQARKNILKIDESISKQLIDDEAI